MLIRRASFLRAAFSQRELRVGVTVDWYARAMEQGLQKARASRPRLERESTPQTRNPRARLRVPNTSRCQGLVGPPTRMREAERRSEGPGPKRDLLAEPKSGSSSFRRSSCARGEQRRRGERSAPASIWTSWRRARNFLMRCISAVSELSIAMSTCLGSKESTNAPGTETNCSRRVCTVRSASFAGRDLSDAAPGGRVDERTTRARAPLARVLRDDRARGGAFERRCRSRGVRIFPLPSSGARTGFGPLPFLVTGETSFVVCGAPPLDLLPPRTAGGRAVHGFVRGRPRRTSAARRW